MLPLHALLFSVRVIMVYPAEPALVSCYDMLCMNKSQFDCQRCVDGGSLTRKWRIVDAILHFPVRETHHAQTFDVYRSDYDVTSSSESVLAADERWLDTFAEQYLQQLDSSACWHAVQLDVLIRGQLDGFSSCLNRSLQPSHLTMVYEGASFLL